MKTQSKLLINVVLCLALLVGGCAKKPAVIVGPGSTPPPDPGVETLIKLKAGGQTLAGLIEDGLALVPTLQESQEITPDAAVTALLILNQAKVTTVSLNEELKKFTRFDPNNPGDIVKLFKSVVSYVSKLNDAGITHIKNPQLRSKIQLALTGARFAINAIAGYLGIDLSAMRILDKLIKELGEIAAMESDGGTGLLLSLAPFDQHLDLVRIIHISDLSQRVLWEPPLKLFASR